MNYLLNTRLPLTLNAIKRGALALFDLLDGFGAYRARQACTAIDFGLHLKLPRMAVGAGKVAQGAAALFHSLA